MPGTIIRKIRENKRLTQEYVAQRMGISQNAYSKIENSVTQLTINHLKKISSILEVPMADLMSDEFEIRKPISIQAASISREDLLMMTNAIKEKLQSRQAQRHEHYPVLMTLFQTVDGILSQID
jgi:transcriptional regulator with XRE-family HTH domain